MQTEGRCQVIGREMDGSSAWSSALRFLRGLTLACHLQVIMLQVPMQFWLQGCRGGSQEMEIQQGDGAVEMQEMRVLRM